MFIVKMLRAAFAGAFGIALVGGVLLSQPAPSASACGDGSCITPTPTPAGKCNSGRGNASETEPANDCDPGNSGGHNNGGD
jgi:hypothetical protein